MTKMDIQQPETFLKTEPTHHPDEAAPPYEPSEASEPTRSSLAYSRRSTASNSSGSAISPALSRAAPPKSAASSSSNQNLPPKPTTKKTLGQRVHAFSSKAGRPLNKAANVLGAEGVWPSTGDKECAKAARILLSFTNLATTTAASPSASSSAPLHPTALTRKSLTRIPAQALAQCRGLAIFNVLRAGALYGSLAGGSGLVVSRRSDGSWSPPSTFVVSTLGGGFVFGLDVYDCVCVLHTDEQVRAFTRPRVSLGGDASIALGPVGTGASVDAPLTKATSTSASAAASSASSSSHPVWSYIKSRGLFAGIQVDGTVIVTRADANAALYGERGITAQRILSDPGVAWPAQATPLLDVLVAVDGHYGSKITADRPIDEFYAAAHSGIGSNTASTVGFSTQAQMQTQVQTQTLDGDGSAHEAGVVQVESPPRYQ